MTDWNELVARVMQRDQAAMAQLYDLTSGQVFGLCIRILRDRDAAEEAALDAYLQVWSRTASYDAQRGTFLAWLLTLARSRALDRLRSLRAATRREEPLERCDPASPADGTPAPALAGERKKLVAAALEKVSNEEREVLGFAFFQGLSHSEIAERLREPLGTVKSRIRSGMMKLRFYLAPLATGGAA